MLQLPHAQGREEKRLRAGETSGPGHRALGWRGGSFRFRFAFAARFGIADAARGRFADGQVSAAVHTLVLNFSSFRASGVGPACLGESSAKRVRRRSAPAERRGKPLVCAVVLRQFAGTMADRKPGCLTIFLFVALCVSVFVNFVLAFAALQRLGRVLPPAEALPRFREIVVQRGSGGSFDKIAVIMLRGLISSSIPGTVGDSMVEVMRAALPQARDDSRVKE